MARKPGHSIKRSLLAVYDLERLGVNPIEEIYEAMSFAKQKAREGGEDEASWGALWLKAATDLATFKHPRLSAVAVSEIAKSEQDNARPFTTKEAIETISKDPFAPSEIKITAERVIEAMDSTIKHPTLPVGKSNNE